jgi:uncharacterized protein (TIGR03083 family)
MDRTVEALAADRDEVLRIGSNLDAPVWDASSGCPGWSIKDVIAHMATTFWTAVDQSALPDTTGLGAEQAAEVCVGARRAMSGPQVLDDYATVSEQALALLEALAGTDIEMDLGDLGTYPAGILPTAFCFDHYTHIRADLFAPRGSLPGPLPASDDLRLVPTLEWIEAALPQQNRAALESGGFDGADIVISGTATRTIRIGNPSGPASATVRSDADAAVRWITQRAEWQSLDVHAEGDPTTLSVLRGLKVF